MGLQWQYASNYPLHTYINENCCPLLIVCTDNGRGGGHVHTWSDGKFMMV